MYFPLPRERVRMRGHASVYLVVNADYGKQFARVIPLAQTDASEEVIRFEDLLPICEAENAETGGG